MANMPTSEPSQNKPKPEWTPHIWEGCDFFAWLRLVCRNRLKVSFWLIYVAVIVTVVSLFHTVLRWLQKDIYGTRPTRAPIPHPPIFIIGHWRTGTTLLHELLILDERHTFPDTYECLAPNHFLLTGNLARKYLSFLMPSRRPMDNMKAGWTRPQEDEFALCMLGLPSPYLTIAFPNNPPMDQEAYTLEQLSPKDRKRWKEGFVRFLRQLSWRDSRRLVLKSPTHSFRIKTLLELFPDARFVHIVRNPYVVYPSTVNLWKTLYETHGLQRPTFERLDERVLSTFALLYEKIEEDRDLVDPSRFYELKYEDLTQNPLGEMEKLYAQLELGEFDRLRPHLEAYFKDNEGYQTNRYRQLSPEQKAVIEQWWKPVIDRYGYSEPS